MAKTRAEILQEIADSTPTGGGNLLRDGRYRFVVRKLALESGFKGPRFTMDLVVQAAQKMQVVSVKTGAALDVEPNAVGTDVGIVKMLSGKGNYQPPGFGDTKAFVLALFGVGDEVTGAELVETLDELTESNSAMGMKIDCVTRRRLSKENQVELVLQDWSHVEQSPEEIADAKVWLAALTTAVTETKSAAKPAAAPKVGPPTMGPPTLGPPSA